MVDKIFISFLIKHCFQISLLKQDFIIKDIAEPKMAEQQHHSETNQFINFDQFVIQHNLSRGHSNNNSAQVVAPVQHQSYDYQNAPAITGSSRNLFDEIIRNSNLTPTANEFVPMQTYYAPPLPQPYQSTASVTSDMPLQEILQPSTSAQVDRQLAHALHATNIGRQQGAIRKNNFGSNSARAPDNNYQRRNNNNWNQGDNGRSNGAASGRIDYKRNNGGQYENRRHNGSGRIATQSNDHYNSNRNGYYNNRNYSDDLR